MNRLYRYPLIGMLLFCLLPESICWSQTVENVKTSFDGEKVIITYDLVHTDATQKFNISVYSSHDDYQKPLSILRGAVGDNVLPGKGNRVIWDANDELPSDFNKEISVRVIATKVAPAVVAIKLSMKPFDKNIYKKGRVLEIKWLGGNTSDKINLQLLRDNEVKLDIAREIGNNQHFTWLIPQKTSSGKNYVIRISDAASPTELSNSQFIQIKPRTPLIVKVLPFLAVGGAILALGGSKKKEEADLPGMTINPN